MRVDVTGADGLAVTVAVSGGPKNADVGVDWGDGTAQSTGKLPAKAGEPLSLSHTYANEHKRIVVARLADGSDAAATVVQIAQIDPTTATTKGRLVIDRRAPAVDGDRYTLTNV